MNCREPTPQSGVGHQTDSCDNATQCRLPIITKSLGDNQQPMACSNTVSQSVSSSHVQLVVTGTLNRMLCVCVCCRWRYGEANLAL